MSFFSKRTIQKDQGDGKVIAFLNQKGGVGKTTLAFNTAHALAHAGHKVLCIDMDPQANLSHLFDVDTSELDLPHIHQLLVNSVRELKAIHTGLLCTDVIIKGPKLDLIPAGQELSGFDLTMAGVTTSRQLILKKFLEMNALKSLYDYIVIDGPPTLGLLVVNILCAGHGVMVPFRPDEFSKKGLGHFYEVLGDLSDMGITQIPRVIAHIPNLMDARRKQENDDLLEISKLLEGHLGEARMVSPFYNRSQLVKSQASKKSVFAYNSKEYAPLKLKFSEMADLIKDFNYEQQ